MAFRQAAERNYAPALFALGRLYEAGLGVDRDETEATNLFRRAAEQDFPAALETMSTRARHGHGTDQDDTEAEHWRRRLAGVPADIGEVAAIWRRIASKTRAVDSVAPSQRDVRVDLTDGPRLRDTVSRIMLEDGKLDRHAADLMACAARARGWTSVTLTGPLEDRKRLAAAMVARGLTVRNGEFKAFVQGLTKEHALAADRAALDGARTRPDLADPERFRDALSRYQAEINTPTNPETTRQLRAEVLARAERVASSGPDPAIRETAARWAEEAQRLTEVCTARAVHVARA